MRFSPWLTAFALVAAFSPLSGACAAENSLEARPWFERALGLDLGVAGAPDAVAAFSAMRRAAEAGDAQAAFNVAVMLDSGRGAARDLTKAALWYARAAARGIPRAAFNLGLLYENGEGVPPNVDMARAWYVASGLPAARERAADLKTNPGRPGRLQAPTPLYPLANGAKPVDIRQIELVWTSSIEPSPVRFFVELRVLDDRAWKEVWSGFVGVSSLRLPLPPGARTLAWRVSAVSNAPADYAISGWSVFSASEVNISLDNSSSTAPGTLRPAAVDTQPEDRPLATAGASQLSYERQPITVSKPSEQTSNAAPSLALAAPPLFVSKSAKVDGPALPEPAPPPEVTASRRVSGLAEILPASPVVDPGSSVTTLDERPAPMPSTLTTEHPPQANLLDDKAAGESGSAPVLSRFGQTGRDNGQGPKSAAAKPVEPNTKLISTHQALGPPAPAPGPESETTRSSDSIRMASPVPAPSGRERERSADAANALTSAPAQPPPAPTVLIVLAQPSVANVTELNNQDVLIAGLTSISQRGVYSALSAAGASRVRLTEGTTNDVQELLEGKVAAAVVARLPPAKAQAFPEISGLKLLRIAVTDR